MEINEAIAKLQPAVGLRLNVTTLDEETTTPTFTEVRFLPDAERATPEHDIIFSYGYTRTIPAPLAYGHTPPLDDPEPQIVRPQGHILPSCRLLSVMWDASPVDPTCIRVTLTHLDWTKTEIKTTSNIFVGPPKAIAKSIEAAIAAGVWQEEN